MSRDLKLLKGKNIVVFDCEIENVIDGKKITWSDHAKMGLSVGVIYDYKTDDFSVYLKNDIQDLCKRLNEADLIVAFNQEGFDIPLLKGCGGDLKALNNYDMLKHSRYAAGWIEGARYPSGLTLDNHLEVIFGSDKMKTMHGSEAPIEWQKGNVGKVISYCLSDVKRERDLFEHIYLSGTVETKAHGLKTINIDPILEVVNVAW